MRNLSASIQFQPAILLCWLIIGVFAAFFIALSLQQHYVFETNGLDVGNVDQTLWNTAQGRFLEFSLMHPVRSRLALHVEPILLFLVPFYWVGLGGPELLLIAQGLIVALGAWPLYQLAQLKLKFSTESPLWYLIILLIIPVAYLLLPTLESAVFFEFHAVTLAPTFFLFAFLALEHEQLRSFFLYIGLAMACKEDMPLVAAMLGVYIGLGRRQWRLASWTILVSIVWFFIAFFVVQPRFAVGGNIQLDRYAWLGDDPLTMLQMLLTQPSLVFNHLWTLADFPNYLFELFFPTAFLALLNPLTLLPILPTLAINLLSQNPFTWRLEDFHYGMPMAPFLFISVIFALKRIMAWTASQNQRQSQTLIALLLLLLLSFSTIYHYHRGYTPLSRAYRWPTISAHHHQLATMLDTIPPDAAIFTQSNLAPHLTHRPTIYTNFSYFTDPSFAAEPIDTVILDVTQFENIGGLHQFLQEILLDQGEYKLVSAKDGILHMSKALETEPPIDLPDAFYTFTSADNPAEGYSTSVDFDNTIRLTHYQLHLNRQEEIEVEIQLEKLQTEPDILPVLYLLDEQGNPLGATTDLQPGLVWSPLSSQSVGTTYHLHFDTLPWHTRDTANYRLALGMIQGDDPWQSPRLRPTPQTELRLPLPADGTLVELAEISQKWGMPVIHPPLRQFEAPFLAHSTEANFGHQIKLLGYDHLTISSEADADVLSIELAWQAITEPQRLIRFAQLVGPDGLVYGQNDSMPDQGQYPTQFWFPNEVVTERVRFPIQTNRPPGQYRLHIGLYDLDTGARLLLVDGGDHIEVSIE